MIELIYGDDDVSVDDALADVMSDVGPAELGDINCIVIRDDDLKPEAVMSAAFTIPFMADRRVVVVRGLLSRFERRMSGGRSRGGSGSGRRNSLGEWADFADGLSDLPLTTRLVFADGATAQNNPMFRKLSPMAEVRAFQLPRDREMPGWVSRRAAALGVGIEPAACAELANAVGRQPRLIDSELRKLALLAEGRRIRADDVRTMVAYVREANIFQAIDAVTDGRTGVALRLVRKIMNDGSSATYVMSMLARQVRLLLLAKDLGGSGAAQDEMVRRMRLSGWALNKTLDQSRRISQEYLVRVHGLLVETDLALKTRPLDDQLAVEMLITEMSLGR